MGGRATPFDSNPILLDQWSIFLRYNCPRVSPFLHKPLEDVRNNEVITKLKRFANPFKRILEELEVMMSDALVQHPPLVLTSFDLQDRQGVALYMTYPNASTGIDDWTTQLRTTLENVKFRIIFMYGSVYENVVRVVVGLVHGSGTRVTPFGVAKLITTRVLCQPSYYVPTFVLVSAPLLGIALAHASLGRISESPEKDVFDPFNGDLGYEWLATVVELVRHTAHGRPIRQFVSRVAEPKKQADIRDEHEKAVRPYGINFKYDQRKFELEWSQSAQLAMAASVLLQVAVYVFSPFLRACSVC